jgi:hypothetical protein
MRGGTRKLDRALEFQGIVGLFEKPRFDLVEVVLNILFAQAEDLQGDRFDHAEIATQAVRHAGILHLHSELLAILRSEMNLADRGAVRRLTGKRIEHRHGLTTEFAAKSPHDKRIRKRRRGILGLGKSTGVGRRKEVSVYAEHLRQLKRPSLESAESPVNLIGILFMKGPLVGLSGQCPASVEFKVIHTHPGATAHESGAARKTGRFDRMLFDHFLQASRRGRRNLARSTAESNACVRMRSNATAADFSTKASVRSNPLLSSMR